MEDGDEVCLGATFRRLWDGTEINAGDHFGIVRAQVGVLDIKGSIARLECGEYQVRDSAHIYSDRVGYKT